jgi:hypothetical protein
MTTKEYSNVNSKEVELPTVYEKDGTFDLEKLSSSPDLHWMNINFTANKKPILVDCWGIVSLNINIVNKIL